MRQDRWCTALVVSGFAWIAVAAAPRAAIAAGDRAVDILQRAVLARAQVNYSGVATLTESQPGGRTRTFIEVLYCRQGGKQNVQVKDGNDQLVVRRICDGSTQWESHVARGAVVRRAVPSMSERRQRDLQNLNILTRNFRTALAGIETVAGRKAYRIRISRPGQPPALVRQYWIDKDTYLELKSEQYGDGGVLTSSMTMTRVNFHPDYPPGAFDFQPPPNVKPKLADDAVFRGPLAEAEKRVGFGAILPRTVPAGFQLLTQSVAVVNRNGTPALWLRYTNGIDAFSLFQRKAPGGEAPAKGRFAVRQWVHGGYQFLLVGRLTSDQIEAIRGSYR